jgi:Flp pilus assembly protein TadB
MTVIALVLAALCILGTPWIALGLSIALWVSPKIGITVVVGLAVASAVNVRRPRRTMPSESDFLRSLAGAILAGSTLREAIRQSESPLVSSLARRSCELGAPMADVGAEVGPHLPSTGEAFAVLMIMSELTGGSVAGSIHLLAEQAADAQQQARDGRVAAAQAKFSAVVVGCIPLAVALGLVVLRGVPEPGGAVVVLPMVAGATAMVAGAVMVFAIARKALP